MSSISSSSSNNIGIDNTMNMFVISTISSSSSSSSSSSRSSSMINSIDISTIIILFNIYIERERHTVYISITIISYYYHCYYSIITM